MDLKCKICGDNNKKGIELLGAHICRECEKNIMKAKINDIRYNYYKLVIKKVWLDYILTSF
ncbi:sigma factor G inhibitor Gin [Thermohalobacter berrensis]|uniref:Inhibitor of sigma-G Gin n=1 Tax=Thermohalobacter berrensis TaxID=99594 RepID=A0A419SU71_9FIRM|nr:sigma factor G inhibitor Gin [Thermohalobacter berrensis]RKD28823.1 hypothetical protein BET03_07275 [Thermohalobacter berrensis]